VVVVVVVVVTTSAATATEEVRVEGLSSLLLGAVGPRGSDLDGSVANEDLCEVDAVGSPSVRAMT
jgi:hypothetical protein